LCPRRASSLARYQISQASTPIRRCAPERRKGQPLPGTLSAFFRQRLLTPPLRGGDDKANLHGAPAAHINESFSRQLDAFRFAKNPPTTGESVFQERS
jgi:hypothetical protein